MSRRQGVPRSRPAPPGILSGTGERLFQLLPTSILENMQHARDESALLWNIVYPRARPRLSWLGLLRLRPLWGSAAPEGEAEDGLTPYYWGLDVAGGKLEGLNEALETVAGREDLLEVDLLLVGERNLVVVEAKHLASAGLCGRYVRGRCPEMHGPEGAACRYWEAGLDSFPASFEFGPRPAPDSQPPPCYHHYQLARLHLLSRRLAERLHRTPHLWLIIPRRRWAEIRPAWLDFADRVRVEEDWRRLRVLTWESLQSLEVSRGRRHD